MTGRLIIISAPSGSGKSTILNWLMSHHPELGLYFSVSCTTRAPRGSERHGVEYFFLSPAEFRSLIAEGAFVEYEEVYTDKYYGTLKSQVEVQRSMGQNIVFDVDVKGGCNIKRLYGSDALSLFIMPPSVEVLRARLESRATDSPAQIAQRVAKAEQEIALAPQFDRVIINDDLATAQNEAYNIINEFING